MTTISINTVDDLLEIWIQKGGSGYGGEAVTQLEHALQTATLAEKADASAELISAALLHDFGHLIHELPADAPEKGVDDHHENIANHQLKSLFPPSVTEPIRLHVAAKRYLCRVENDYFESLSAPSITSLELQGGPMSEQEQKEFESNVYYLDAVRLRRWDDLAKIPDLPVPALNHFSGYLLAAMKNKS